MKKSENELIAEYNKGYNQGLFTALNLLALVGETPQVYRAKELIREQIQDL